VNKLQVRKIDLTAVGDTKTAGLWNQVIQNPEVMHFLDWDLDKRCDETVQIEKGMESSSAFAFAEDGRAEN
jgi:hypothetical protein